MVNIKDCFYHLDNFPTLPVLYSKAAESADYLDPSEHGTEARSQYAECLLFAKTAVYQKLSQHFRIKSQFIKFDPWSFYDWHVDAGNNGRAGRQCAINYVLTDNPGATTLYRLDQMYSLNYRIGVCDYTRLRPTLFNTQISHCVSNPTDRTRYILSVSLMDITFESARDILQSISFDNAG